ncbi:MAG: restriction endonuclease [Thermomicrobiales bacterium]
MSQMPTWDKFLVPVLQYLSDNMIRPTSDIRKSVIAIVGLTPEQISEPLQSGPSRAANRIGWAIAHLTSVDAIERPARGKYRITPVGANLLKRYPGGITERILRTMAKPDDPFWSGKHSDAGSTTVTPEPEPEPLDPMEQIEQGMARIHTAVAADLLERLQSKDPTFFETAVVRLLVAMGYGGADGKATVTQQSHDGGIDGVIDRDALGLDRVYIQAKRYPSDTGVQRPEVQAFVGALSGKATTGVLLTTGCFSKGATEYAATAHTRVILIDGHRLTDLMIRYGVGVQNQRTLHVVAVDEDFFE